MRVSPLLLRVLPLLLAVALLIPLMPPPPAAQAQTALLRWAYYVDWDPASFEMLQLHLNDLEVVAAHTGQLLEDGSLRDDTDFQVRTLLKQFNGKALLGITNGNFDQETARVILNDEEIRERALSELAAIGEPWDGIALDFEDLDPADRDAYSSFIRDLKERLGPDRTLGVAVVAQTYDAHEGWAGGYDYQAIGEAADLVFIMGYAFRTANSSTNGPVAPLPWLDDVLAFAVQRVPRERLVLGLPAYGYDWRDEPHEDDPETEEDESLNTRGRSVTHGSAIRLQREHNVSGPSYDWERSGAYFRYQDEDEQWREVWYEDRLTFDQKLALIGRYRIGGVGWWRLGGEDPGAWGALKARASGGRFFAQTGYTISSPQVLSFFEHRGDVAFFGFPVSNEFLLLGSRVQIFQRGALQVTPDGAVRLLNLFDPDMLPLGTVNGSTLPPFDPALAAQAPLPTDPNYGRLAPDWIRQVVPDEWQGLAVNFRRAYFGSVTCLIAFAEGECQEELLPLMALELWGLPTSAPTRDVSNHNFVYQRFQRGVMHFDLTSGATQGLLLGDVFKSVLTGQNLPADVDREQHGSRFYRQYDPTRPAALSRPELLPSTDLRGAFQ